MKRRILSTLLAILIALTLLPGVATAANFNTSYTLSGSSADKMVSVATAQIGRSRGTMGYTDSWCARFVSDTASKAGENVAIPYNAGCRQLYNAIIAAGGTEVTSPQKGDIVFFVCTKCKVNGYNNAFSHVGIMLDGSGTCISGNYTTRGVSQVAQHSVYSYQYEPHSVSSGAVTLKYVRPNYSNTTSSETSPAPATQVDLRLEAWISENRTSWEQSKKERAKQGKRGKFYYLWFRLYDQNTGKLYSELSPSTDYNTNMTIVASDGTQHSTDYPNSDNNWRGFPADAAGTYTCKIVFTGGVTGSGTFAFHVVEDKPVISPDRTSITVEAGKSVTCNFSIVPNGGKYVSASAGNAAVCSHSWGQTSLSNGIVTAPLVITGKTAGTTTVTAYVLDANQNNLVASTPISVTVAAPASPPTIAADKSEVSLFTGEKATVNLSFQFNGASAKSSFQVENTAVCSAAWDKSSSNDGKRTLTVAGLSAGATSISVNLLDDGGKVLATRKIAVKVADKPQEQVPLELSTSAVTIYMEEGDSQSFDISWSGTVPKGCKINVQSIPSADDPGVVSLKWGAKGNTSRTVVVTGNRAGKVGLYIYLKDSLGNNLAGSSVGVVVNAKKEQASISLSSRSVAVNLIESQEIIASYSGNYTRRTFEFDRIGIFLVSTENEECPGTSESISISGIRAGSASCRVVLEDSNGNTLASESFTVTVLDNPSLDDVISTPGSNGDWFITAQEAVSNATSAELEDDIGTSNGNFTAQGSGQSSILVGFSGSGTTEVTNGAVADTGESVTNETITIQDVPAGSDSSTSAGISSTAVGGPAPGASGSGSSTPEAGQALRFMDVASDKYYYEPVQWAEAVGVTTGISGTSLGPNGNCPRGQVVEFIWRALGAPEPKTTVNPFSDIAFNDSYYKAVLWAYETGVTTGSSKTEFSPGDTCTRAQVMTFLWRAKGEPASAGANTFSDVAGGAYYINAVNWAVENDVTTGTSATTFSPSDTCTRAQILTFLFRSVAGDGIQKT